MFFFSAENPDEVEEQKKTDIKSNVCEDYKKIPSINHPSYFKMKSFIIKRGVLAIEVVH